MAIWPFGHLSLLVLAALVTGGGTSPDCDNRGLAWGTTSDYESHLLSQAGTDTVDVTPVTSGSQQARWYGDDQSRLVLYSWGSEHTGVSYSSLKTHAKALRASERSWPNYQNSDQYGRYTQWFTGQPCVNGVCGAWKSVRSVDIGFCSIEVPHVPRTASQTTTLLTDTGLHGMTFASEVIDNIEAQLDDQMHAGSGCATGDCDVYTRLRTSDPSTWWVSTDYRDNEVCFRVPFEARIDKGVSCPYKGIQVSFCGVVDLNSQGLLTWQNTRSHYSRYINPLAPICNTARKRVANTVLDRITRTDSSPDGPNEVSMSLRESMNSFSMTPEMLDPNHDNGLMHHNCLNPSPFPGTPDLFCLIAVGNELPATCVSKPGGGGECRYFAPISRVEMLPSGMEIVLAEQVKGEPSNLNALVNNYDGTDPLVESLRYDHCAAPDGEPVSSLSRHYERVIRGTRSVIFETPHNSTLD